MKIKPDLKLREIAGEKIIVMNGPVGVDLTKVVTLNKSAEFLWNNLKGREFQENDVIELLETEYQISNEQAKKDASEWVDSMIKVGLIEC